MITCMRTTLTIDDDVLAAAKGLAAKQHKNIGQVISELVRQALQPIHPHETPQTRNGVPLLPSRNAMTPVTPEMVQQLREELQ